MSLMRRAKAALRALTHDQFMELGLIQPSVASAVTVTPYTALTISAFLNGITVISGDLGVIDRFLYKVNGDDREKARTHPVYKLIHDQPNPFMTSQVFWQALSAMALVFGNAFAEIERDNAQRPIALWLLAPDRIVPIIETKTDESGRKMTDVYYLYNGTTRLDYGDVFHLPGMSFDGLRGYSVITLAREALGLTIATERFGAMFFGEGAWPGIALQHPGELTKPAQLRLKEQFNEMHQPAAGGRPHRVIVLEEGMKVSKPITIAPDEAQFLQTRSFQIEEVARILNLPPHKLKHKVNERPGGNFEASQIDYLQTTLLPWTTKIEQEAERKLISASQRGTYYVEHLYERLLRIDIATRVAAEEAWTKMGALTPEQVARIENFPKPKPASSPAAPAAPTSGTPPVAEPLDTPPGDTSGEPADRTAASSTEVRVFIPDPPRRTASEPVVASDPAPTNDERLRIALEAMAEDAASRYVRREAGRVRQAAKEMGSTKFRGWLRGFYDRERSVLTDIATPLVRCCQAAQRSTGDVAGVAEGIARVYAERSQAKLLALPLAHPEFEVDRLVGAWERDRVRELVKQVMTASAEEEKSNG